VGSFPHTLTHSSVALSACTFPCLYLGHEPKVKVVTPLKQMMKVLKGYLHSMAQPERSMVEGYMLGEMLGFVTEYFDEFEHMSKIVWDVEEGVFGEVLEGVFRKVVLSSIFQDLAHDYVLTNIEIMGPWI
jgi:hypothetical protein